MAVKFSINVYITYINWYICEYNCDERSVQDSSFVKEMVRSVYIYA